MNEFLFFLLVSKSPLEREREMQVQLEKSFFPDYNHFHQSKNPVVEKL